MPGPLARTSPTAAADGAALQKIPNLVYVVTLAAALTLDATYPEVCKLDPGGADRNVTLDHVANDAGKYEGLRRRIIHGGDNNTETLSILAEDGTTVLTSLHLGEQAEFFCSSSGWILVSKGTALSFEAFTLAGTTSLGPTYPTICKLDPGGAGRTVNLDNDGDAGVVGLIGKYRRIINAADAAEDLTIKAADGSTTVATINQNEQAEFYCGTSGWVLICVSTIALS